MDKKTSLFLRQMQLTICILLAASCSHKDSGNVPKAEVPPDPVAIFKQLATDYHIALKNEFEGKANPIAATLGTRATVVIPDDYNIDVVKTDSVLTPYKGKIFWRMTDRNADGTLWDEQFAVKHQTWFDWAGDHWVLGQLIYGGSGEVADLTEWPQSEEIEMSKAFFAARGSHPLSQGNN